MVRRTTTGMNMNLYRYNLQGSTSRLSDAQQKMLSHRQFDSYAEDPAAATQAWRTRRAITNTESYMKNNHDTYTRFNIAWSTLDVASYKLTNLDGRSADIYAASDPTASGRQALGLVLKETAESVAQVMNNAKSGENFVFGGDDELNAPFSWENGQLYYRGVNVNAGGVKSPAEAPDWVPKSSKPVPDPKPVDYDPTADVTEDAALAKAYRDTLPKTTSFDLNSDSPQERVNAKWEQAWMDYYQDSTVTTQPDATDPAFSEPDADGNPITPTDPPSWVPKDGNGDPVSNSDADMKAQFLKTLPDPAANDIEQAWVDYYKGTSQYKPTYNPDENGAWEGLGRDDFGTIKGVSDMAKDPTQSAFNRAWAAYLADQGEVKKLEAMSKEEAPIDLGMGLMEGVDRTDLVNGTYFDRSLPGINMLGWGIDEDGDPKNVCMIMVRLGEIYSNCHPETGSYDKDDSTGTSAKAQATREEAMRLLDKLKAGKEHVTDQYVQVNAKGSFLKQNEDRLTLQGDYLNEQLTEIENVDLADAIMQLSWDYYCYSAALKVGTQLLSQSLIDYMS